MNPSQRRIRLDLSYDGTAFEGWQFQPRGRTVQGTVEEALTRIQGNRPARIRAAGRTDSGAHARNQVADGLIETALDDGELEHALHRMLPDDVRPLRVSTVPDGFHSQRDARHKTYRYFLDRSRYGNPRLMRYAWRPCFSVEVEGMEQALARLVGRKDWSAFTGAKCSVEDRVRNLTEARFEMLDSELGSFVFSADGFLTYMVRNLVGTVLEVGRGRHTVERLDEILASRDAGRSGPTAPAKGLCLWKVIYDGQPDVGKHGAADALAWTMR